MKTRSTNNMKKYVIFTAAILLATSGHALAASGACSYHGGVNCNINSAYATCNDGWTSSVDYQSVSECKQTDLCLYGAVDQATHDKAVSDFNSLTNSFMNDASQTFSNSLNDPSSGSYAKTVLSQAKTEAYKAQANVLEGLISCPIKIVAIVKNETDSVTYLTQEIKRLTAIVAQLQTQLKVKLGK